ncbi:hypothetical protein PspLS_11116 [Pyricularia sp. CBS 133598]|nr:hypothetical protein PspLS_11116 [Pyricularia sp. CBS 133598]
MRAYTFLPILLFAVITMALPTPDNMGAVASVSETSLDDGPSRLAARNAGDPGCDKSDDDGDDNNDDDNDDEYRYRVYDPDDPSTHVIEDVD